MTLAEVAEPLREPNDFPSDIKLGKTLYDEVIEQCFVTNDPPEALLGVRLEKHPLLAPRGYIFLQGSRILAMGDVDRPKKKAAAG